MAVRNQVWLLHVVFPCLLAADRSLWEHRECQSHKIKGVWVSASPHGRRLCTSKKQLHWTAAWAQDKLLLCKTTKLFMAANVIFTKTGEEILLLVMLGGVSKSCWPQKNWRKAALVCWMVPRPYELEKSAVPENLCWNGCIQHLPQSADYKAYNSCS